jgi:hypothetical protein
MDAAAQHPGLVAGFTVQGDEDALDRAFSTEAFLHNTDPVVGDDAHTAEQQKQQPNYDHNTENNNEL